MRLVVLDGYALNPGDLSWDALEALAQVTVYDRTPAAEVVARAADAELLLTNKTPVSSADLAALPAVRYIGVMATGYDNVDIAFARTRGIVVSNIPTYGTASVAQFAIALLLELCHNAGLHSTAVRAGEWNKSPDWSFWKTPLVELAGKTLGIIGYGRIGRHVGRIGAALEMQVIAFDSGALTPEDGVRQVSLEELLAVSDVLSLHCPLFPNTRGLINRDSLARMKKGAMLINTSRGGLVVEQDLADALNSGHLAGAAVDVVQQEPPISGSPLFSARNCIVTPHIAWATREARSRLMSIAIENVRAFLAGTPQNVVS